MVEKISTKKAQKQLSDAAPIVLIINIVAALALFFLADALFANKEVYLGTLLGGAFLLCGVFSYIILKLMGKQLTIHDEDNK